MYETTYASARGIMYTGQRYWSGNARLVVSSIRRPLHGHTGVTAVSTDLMIEQI